MKMTRKILIAILICLPMLARGESDLESISNARNTEDLKSRTYIALQNLTKKDYCKGNEDECASVVNKYITDNKLQEKEDEVKDSEKDSAKNAKKNSEEKAAAQKKVDDAQAKLDAAKEKEQSTANKLLTGLSVATMGIGASQLAQGMSEKSADSAADADMDAYVATMRCKYGEGKSVPFGVEPVELPGGNNSELMKYRAEYVALAADLKERKAALDMKPGIEAEEILDKATMGLYDDENTGITSGHYASRYRAIAGSEKDKKGLASDKKEAKNRMIAGGVLAGAGLVGSIVGNSIINGKLGELIKESRANKQKSKDHDATVKAIKKALKDKGYKNVDDLNFDNVDVGALKEADWSKLTNASGDNTDAKSLISTANKTSLINSLSALGVKGSDDE